MTWWNWSLFLESLRKDSHGSIHELLLLRGPKGLTNRNSFCSARTKIRGPISRHHYSLRDGLRRVIVSTEGHIPDPFSPWINPCIRQWQGESGRFRQTDFSSLSEAAKWLWGWTEPADGLQPTSLDVRREHERMSDDNRPVEMYECDNVLPSLSYTHTHGRSHFFPRVDRVLPPLHALAYAAIKHAWEIKNKHIVWLLFVLQLRGNNYIFIAEWSVFKQIVFLTLLGRWREDVQLSYSRKWKEMESELFINVTHN